MNIKKMLFTNTPANFKKDFINNLLFINYTRTKIFSFLLIFISGLMYIISILEKDAIFIIHANLVFFILSIIVAILFNIKKIYNENDIKNYHKIIISLLIIIVLSWSTALIIFNPNRYELIGTYAIVILSISSFIFLKWQMNLFILGSSFFITYILDYF